MAGTWRVAVEAVEGLKITAAAGDPTKQESDEAPPARTLVVEVGDGRGMQRTRPFEVPDDGILRVNRVLFIPAPTAGTQLALRVFKVSKGEPEGRVGDGVLPAAFGSFQVELIRRQRCRGLLRVNISEGLPSPPTGAGADVRMAGAATLPVPSGAGRTGRLPTTPNSATPNMNGLGASPASSTPGSALGLAGDATGGSSRPSATLSATRLPAAAPRRLPPSSGVPSMGARTPLGPPTVTNVRPLRMRMPGLPFIGNCDVTIEGMYVPESLQQPFLIVGLEGQEFLAEDLTRRLNYTFQMGAVQNSLTVYCYSAAQPHKPLGRVLLPLTDVLWPSGKAPNVHRVRMSFEKELRHFQRSYTLQFLPPNEAGDSHSDPTFVDTFDTHLSEANKHGAESFGAFGEIALSVEVTFRQEVSSLVGFYLASVLSAAKVAATSNGPAEVPVLPISSDLASMNILDSPALRSLLDFLWRLKHYSDGPSTGFIRFVKEHRFCGYACAALWFLFCSFGFFPCSAWVFPIYLWLALVGNGLVAAFQRQADWEQRGEEAKDLFWKQPDLDDQVPDSPNSKAMAAFGRCIQQLHEVEPMVRTFVLFLERAGNLLTFADGLASLVAYIILGGMLTLASLGLLIVSHTEGIPFLVGAYGALLLFMVARKGGSQGPLGMQGPRGVHGPGAMQAVAPERRSFLRLFNQAFACVPDQAEVAHRFVAAKVQDALCK